MKKIIIKNGNIDVAVNKMTHNSEIYGDEKQSVKHDLIELLRNANKYGTAFEGVVPNCWGENFLVVALPKRRQRSWKF